MSKRLKMWLFIVAMCGGASLFSCSFGSGNALTSIYGAILQEDLFG